MSSITPPAVTQKILQKGEVFNDEGFHHLTVVWTENSQIYHSKLPCRDSRWLSFDDINKVEATLIPKEHIYPAWRENVTEVQTPLPFDTYIKTTQRLADYDGTSGVVDLINAEVDIMEILLKKFHPNICKYYGCIRDGDYIVGICLQKYKYTLEDIIKTRVPVDQLPHFDTDLILADIKAGLDWLHGLGLVHDDINPSNIMLDNGGRAVIIDFDSCASIGAKSRGGTPGWSMRPTVAEVANDEHGLNLVAKYIRGEYDGHDFEAFGLKESDLYAHGPDT